MKPLHNQPETPARQGARSALVPLALLLAACSGGGLADPGPAPRSAQAVIFRTSDATQVRGVNDTGSNEVVLASAANNTITMFELSPDGRALAFVTDNDTANTFELYVKELNGGPATKVSQFANTTPDVSDFAWSPNSQKLAYRADTDVAARAALHSVRRDGSDHYKVNDTLSSSFEVGSYRWSPNSRYLAFSRFTFSSGEENTLYLHDGNTQTTGATDFFTPGSDEVTDLGWSPDGQWVTYRTDSFTTGARFEAFRYASDGSSANLRSNLPVGSSAQVIESFWSPDSRYVANRVLLSSGGNTAVEVYDIQTSSGARVAESSVITKLAWSPTRNDLAVAGAFVPGAGPSSVERLYVFDVDAATWQTASEDFQGSEVLRGETFEWSPNGNKLAYATFITFLNERLFIATTRDSNPAVEASDVAGLIFDSLTWSPDSSLLGVLDYSDSEFLHPGEFHLVNSTGASNWQSGTVFTFGASRQLVWSPDSVWAMISTPDVANDPNRVRGVVRNGTGDRRLSESDEAGIGMVTSTVTLQ